MSSNGSHGASGTCSQHRQLDLEPVLEPLPLSALTLAHSVSVLSPGEEVKTLAISAENPKTFTRKSTSFPDSQLLDRSPRCRSNGGRVKARIGIAAIAVAVLGFSLIKTIGNRSGGGSLVRARLTDVRALPVGAPVTIAGLPVGSIVARRVGSGYAEIDIEFNDEVDLRKDATLFKRRISLLSGPSLELDPGESDAKLEGKYIERVVETDPIGDVLYEISEALPGVQEGANEGMQRAEQLRAQVNGPITEKIESFDEAAEDIATRMHNRLGAMNRALARGETFGFEPRESIEPVIARAEDLTSRARSGMGQARDWVVDNAAIVRRKVDETQVDWSKYAVPISNVDEGQGTLGRLLNKSETHEDIVDSTGDVRSLIRALVRWRNDVGLKTEWAVNGQGPTSYVTLKAGRQNRFYYMEIVGSSRGGVPSAAVEYDGVRDSWSREVEIDDALRFTFQYATGLGPVVLRYGFKESTFGLGTDVSLINNRLEVSADLFEVGVDDLPRVKLAASLRVFAQLYVLAGLDDILNPGKVIDTSGSNDVDNLARVYRGRDVFFGAGLQFSDRDLTTLLRLGSTALGSLLF